MYLDVDKHKWISLNVSIATCYLLVYLQPSCRRTPTELRCVSERFPKKSVSDIVARAASILAYLFRSKYQSMSLPYVHTYFGL